MTILEHIPQLNMYEDLKLLLQHDVMFLSLSTNFTLFLCIYNLRPNLYFITKR